MCRKWRRAVVEPIREQWDAISINVSEGSRPILDRAWRYSGGSRRVGIIE
jgi:hypothetical protein